MSGITSCTWDRLCLKGKRSGYALTSSLCSVAGTASHQQVPPEPAVSRCGGNRPQGGYPAPQHCGPLLKRPSLVLPHEGICGAWPLGITLWQRRGMALQEPALGSWQTEPLLGAQIESPTRGWRPSLTREFGRAHGTSDHEPHLPIAESWSQLHHREAAQPSSTWTESLGGSTAHLQSQGARSSAAPTR